MIATDTTVDPAMRRRAVIASTLGNALEWFDFTVFGLFAGVIGKLFFPAQDPANSLLYTFATFGIAFAARPIGGIVFGIYADKWGRKSALVIMILAMAVGTGIIGILPTYASISIFAPIMILVARLIQGFSAGGEFGSASAMLIEFAPPNRRGFYGSWQAVSQALATVLGALFASVLSKWLSPDAFATWGWRVPFLLGVLIGPIGVYLRQRVDESPEFKSFRASRNADTVRRDTPLRDVLRYYPRELVVGFCLVATGTSINYVGSTFLPAFASTDLRLELADAQIGLLAVGIGNVLLAPLTGALSDRVGRRAVILPGIILYGVLSFIMFKRLVAEPTAVHLWQLQACGVLLAVLFGPTPAFLTEIFPIGMRSTGASLVYNFAVMFFGGLAPFTNQWLIKVTGDKSAPVYYISFACLVGITGLLLYRKRAIENPALQDARRP